MIPCARQIEIRLGKSPVTVYLSTPDNIARWVVIPRNGDALDAAIQQAGQSFYHAQLGVMFVQLDGLRGPAAAQKLHAAVRWLRKQPEAQGLPVSYFGVDVGTALALQAVSGANDVASVVSWNGRPELAWKYLGAVRTPVLLMVDKQQNWLRYWANHVVDGRLGPVSRLERVAGPSDMVDLALDWMGQNRYANLSNPRPSLTRRLATGVVALGLCVSLATATQAKATSLTNAPATSVTSPAYEVDPFSDGLVLGAGNIAGDENIGASHEMDGPTSTPFPDGYKLGEKNVAGDGMRPKATGSRALIDGGGLKWFANTNITFSTSSSASGAVSEASFTGPVAATTISGGTTASTLNDAYDGYNALMINGTLPADTGSDVIYNKNGPATLECSGRQVVLPQQVVGDLTVQRKLYVPDSYEFARWTNIYTNTGTVPITITTGTSNNLGSDSNTRIIDTSSGDATAGLDDLWVTTMQNYSGTTSSDPRLGHVLQGNSPPVGLSVINFVNGDDNPYWGYNLVIPPGKTAVILNFATGQPSKAAAASMSAWLADLPAPTLQCLTDKEMASVVNFNMPTDVGLSASAQAPSVRPGDPITYTVDVTNAGTNLASGIVVTGTLPTGSTYQGSSGTGWAIVENSGMFTATRDLVQAATMATFKIDINAPSTPGTIEFTANVDIDNTDTDPTNNTVTVQTEVLGDADLSVSLADSPDPVLVGHPLTYTLQVANTGPKVAQNVMATVTLPSGAGFVSGSGAGWTVIQSGSVVTATRSTLDVADAPPVYIQVTAPAVSGTIQATGEVSADNNDPVLANNMATVQTEVISDADLSVSLTGSQDPMPMGHPLTYTLQVANAGPNIAQNVVATVTLPSEADFVSCSGDGWTVVQSGGVVTATRSTLDVADAPPVYIQVMAPFVLGTMHATGEVSADNNDPVPANNVATEDTSMLLQIYFPFFPEP